MDYLKITVIFRFFIIYFKDMTVKKTEQFYKERMKKRKKT